MVFSARSDVAALGGVSVGQLVAQDMPAIESLEEDLAALEVKLDPAVDVMRWVGRFSGGAAWVPMLTRELASWDRNATRVRRDLAAATRMLSSSTYLLDDYDLARSKLAEPDANGSLARLAVSARQAVCSVPSSASRSRFRRSEGPSQTWRRWSAAWRPLPSSARVYRTC